MAWSGKHVESFWTIVKVKKSRVKHTDAAESLFPVRLFDPSSIAPSLSPVLLFLSSTLSVRHWKSQTQRRFYAHVVWLLIVWLIMLNTFPSTGLFYEFESCRFPYDLSGFTYWTSRCCSLTLYSSESLEAQHSPSLIDWGVLSDLKPPPPPPLPQSSFPRRLLPLLPW